MVFDAKASEKLMQDIRNSISVTTLEEYLNCGRTLAQDLVKVGIVERLLPENDKISGVLKSVNRESADKLLHRLMQASEIVPLASDGMMSIFSAAEVSRWPTLDIVRGILSGMFKRVEMIDPNLKIKGLLVNPVDVRQALQHSQIEGYIGFEDAVVMIGMAPEALNKTLQMQKQDGSPYLGVHVVNNAKGIPVRLFSVDELQAFSREYVSLKECAEVEMTSPLAMKIKLDERGIMPIAPKYKLGRIWYRREDLDAI